MITIQETLTAGQPKRYPITGSYFKLLAAINPVDLKFAKEASPTNEADQVTAGFFTRKSFEFFYITSSITQQIKFCVADEDMGYDPINQSARRAQFTTVGQTTWTVPSEISEVFITCIGGGGGGGGGFAANGGGGGGGGGAIAVNKMPVPVTAGDVLTINVGAGGNSGAIGGNGGSGGNSTVVRNSLSVVWSNGQLGGFAGAATNGGSGGGGFGAAAGAGGAGAGAAGTDFSPKHPFLASACGGGAGGAVNFNGGVGTSGGAQTFAQAGGNGQSNATNGGGGGGGFSMIGNAGVGGSAPNGPGSQATGYGGGGGGGSGNAAGGAGAQGIVIIEW